MTPQELFSKAIALYKSGQKDDAENCCLEIIRLHPAFADAYNLSGLIARDKKDLQNSVKQFRIAIQLNSKTPIYFNNLGQSLSIMGKEEEALKSFHKALSIDSNFIPSLLQIGKILRRRGDFENAIIAFEKILVREPANLPALNNLANVYQLQKKYSKAIELYFHALQYNPKIVELHYNLGNVFLRTGQLKEAEQKLNDALQLNPSFYKTYISLSQLYLQRGQTSLVKDCLVKALKIFPNDSEALFMLGNYFRVNGEYEKAIAFFKKSLSVKSDNVMALYNLGLTFFSIGMNTEANESFEKALQIAPNHHEALYGMAKLKESEKKYEEALLFFSNALNTPSPYYIQVLFDYCLLKLRIVDWNTYDQDIHQLLKHLNEYLIDPRQNFQISPLSLNYFPIPQDLHKKTAEKYAYLLKNQVADIKTKCNFSYPSYHENEKIRIGYISPDFRFHAVGMLLNQLFAHHDKSKFKIYAYSIINNNDEYNLAFKNGADVFHDISKLSHEESARLINNDKIHVLIDLAGYTTYVRSQILALKPAPVQMHLIGYPDTMGGDFMDYILADHQLIPENDQQHYTEKVAYLDHAFFSSPLKTSERKFERKDFGLPENSFVYCCYNSYHKLSPELFDTWMQILLHTENTVLWLTKENDAGANNILKEAEKRGVGRDRIIFASRLPFDEYLSSYSCADLFLDTFTYNAGSTAVCALWGGVPVLTYSGSNNASRMGASIVKAAGLDEFICLSKEEYFNKAIELSRNKAKVDSVKDFLNKNKHKSSLFDMAKAVDGLENCLKGILGNN